MGLAMSIMGFLSAPLKSVLDKVITDKNLRQKIEGELNLAILKASADKGKDFAKRVIAEIHHPNLFRDAVRPLITYFAFGLSCFKRRNCLCSNKGLSTIVKCNARWDSRCCV